MRNVFKKSSPFYPAIKVSIIYFIISTLWIFLSDSAVNILFQDAEMITKIQSIKGWLFITLTSYLIYELVKLQVKKEQKLKDQYRFIFESLPISIWEEDITAIRKWLKTLPITNTNELKIYLDNNPQEVLRAAKMIDILKVNAETLTLYGAKSKEHLIENFEKILPEDSLTTFKEELLAIYEGKRLIVKEEAVGRKIDGTLFNFLIKFNIPKENETAPLVVAIIDISKQKEIEAHLTRAKQHADEMLIAKNEFLGIMGHEIRTPVNIINGIVEILKDEQNLNGDRKRFMELLDKSTKALLGILSSMMDLSRLESNKIEINKTYFPLVDFTLNIETLCKFFAEDKGLSFEIISESDKTVEIYTDRLRLEQIVVNLVVNAIKFTERGSVSLVLRTKNNFTEERLEIIVNDTGIGMTPSELEKAFEMFSQGDSSTTRKHSGSGIGLTLAKRLTDLLEGKISVSSTKGVGTKFTVELPVTIKNEVGTAHDTKNIDYQFDLKDKRILIVDDSSDNLILLDAMLKKHGVVVSKAVDGKIAFSMYQSEAFDLILMDIQMPVMDGIQCTKVIREFESSTQKNPIPIIFVSAHAQKSDVEAAKSSGGNDFVAKPIRKEMLLGKIVEHLKN